MSDSAKASDRSEFGAKHPRGSDQRRRHEPLDAIAWVTLIHVSVLVIATTWAFGGQADWVRVPLLSWASLAPLIALAALLRRQGSDALRLRTLKWLLPVAAFNAIVVIACFNPTFREVQLGSESFLAHTGGINRMPSTVRPDLALHALWFFDAIYLSCFNLALIIRQRRALRWLLLATSVNACALAIFGAVQKFSGATGIFFNAIATPQKFFFASFVYHNHWGAFILLMICACLALTWHASRRKGARNIFHTPAPVGVVVLLVLAVTTPLSGSRSTTLLTLLVMGASGLHLLTRMIAKRRRYRESIVMPLAGAAAALIFGAAAIWFVAHDAIKARARKTAEQVTEMREKGTLGDRPQLYRDTWQMAREKPWFGWGMASYPQIFSSLFNTRRSVDRLPVYYHDAHSDWLQAFAEHGVVGSTLLALSALMPLASLRHRFRGGVIPAYLLGGCLLILLYAWIEFPFGNMAVVLTWWLCFFVAVQYIRLSDAASSREQSTGAAAPSISGT